jgi:hypothetical protein
MSPKTRTGHLLLLCSILISAVTSQPALAYEADYIKNFGTFHFLDNGPVDEEIDLRVSLWSMGIPMAGEIDANGNIVTTTEHYGGWQHVLRVKPDLNGDFGFDIFNPTWFPNLPEIYGYNAFLQAEFKYPSEPDTAYRLLDMLGDSPDRLKRWLLVDTLTCMDPWLKHTGTVNSEFSLASFH